MAGVECKVWGVGWEKIRAHPPLHLLGSVKCEVSSVEEVWSWSTCQCEEGGEGCVVWSVKCVCVEWFVVVFSSSF